LRLKFCKKKYCHIRRTFSQTFWSDQRGQAV